MPKSTKPADPNAPKKPRLTLKQRVEAVQQIAKSDRVVAGAMPAVQAVLEQQAIDKAAFKRTNRRLRNLLKGLLDAQ